MTHTPGKTELLGDTSVLLSLYPPQVPRAIVNSVCALIFCDTTPIRLATISYVLEELANCVFSIVPAFRLFTSTLVRPVSTETVNSVTDLQGAVCQTTDVNTYISISVTTPSLHDGACSDSLWCTKWRQLNLQRRRRVDYNPPPFHCVSVCGHKF